MENCAKKRVRSSNWSEDEKRLLTQLVTERVRIIENKDTSTNTNNKKKAAWQEVLSCFNSLSSKKRDLTQLMTQWRNTKGKVKSRESEYRRARLLTGGGPPPPSPPAEDLAIIQALPNEFKVDTNYFDSDSLYMKTIKQSETSESPSMLKDYNEPRTPVPFPCNQIGEPIEVIQILEDSEQPEAKELVYTPVSTPKPQNIKTRCKPVKILNKKTKPNDNDYEHQLFLLAKKSKERENERAEEIHKKRMTILDLEQEYWQKKLNNI